MDEEEALRLFMSRVDLYKSLLDFEKSMIRRLGVAHLRKVGSDGEPVGFMNGLDFAENGFEFDKIYHDEDGSWYIEFVR